MKTKRAKKSKFHYHVCSCGKWMCKNNKCNLSSHAKCGFRVGNDYISCVKDKPVIARMTFEGLAAKLVSKEITRKRFLCDAVRLNLNGVQAALQLREYRKVQRRLAKKLAKKVQKLVHPENIIEIPEPIDSFICLA